jgi:short-subunit dehydrogenase
VLGASSDLGRALARAYARAGYDLVLAARDVTTLEPDALDLRRRFGGSVVLRSFDVLDAAQHRPLVQGIPDLNCIVCAIGFYGNHQEALHTPEMADSIMRTNYIAPALLLNEIARTMEQHRAGTIIGISSVVGDRGRAKNYMYGSAKAGFTAFLSGLRNRLAGKGVHVMTVKPGYIRNPDVPTSGLRSVLSTSPDIIASRILQAAQRKRNVVYIGAIWRLVTFAVDLLPERIFKRLRF